MSHHPIPRAPLPSLQAEFESSMPAPLRRAHKAGQLVNQVGQRAFETAVASASVLTTKFDEGTWRELFAMQVAVVERLQAQQRAFMSGLTGIGAEYEQLQQAKTLSKFVLQEYNVMSQLGALAAAQASSYMELIENFQVNFAFWLDKKSGDDCMPAPQAQPVPADDDSAPESVTPLRTPAARKRA